MRARPREINIFNMSLLDILCGALGAFCFMMLVALPYYVSTPNRAESQKRTEELMKDVEKLRERMSDPAQAEELRKLIDELQAQIKQLEGQLNQAEYENQQLKAENTRVANENQLLTSDNQALTSENALLTSDNQKLLAENAQLRKNQGKEIDLATRKPFLILAMAVDSTQDLSLFLEDEVIAGQTDKTKFANGNFDPNILMQTGWENDLANIHVPRRGVTLWISSRTIPKSSYRLFVRYISHPVDNSPFSNQLHSTRVRLDFTGGFVGKNEAWVQLEPERPWVLAGTLSIDERGVITYKEATGAERDEAWRAIAKSEPPTPTPTASAPAGLDKDEMERLRKQSQEERRKLEEERARREQQSGVSPSPSVSASAGPNEDEIRQRRERALRELQMRSPSPTPAQP